MFPFLLRAGTPADFPYVLDTWVMTHSKSPIAQDAGHAYIKAHKRLARLLLDRSVLTCCVHPDDTTTILGWAVTARSTTLHYVYVHADVRKLKIAKTLLAPLLDEPCVYTHKPRFTMPTPKGWAYVPAHYWLIDRLTQPEPDLIPTTERQPSP